MNKSIIDIGIKIDLQKLIDTRLLIQAGSGGGKSYAIRKLSESVGNKVQQIILDPEGEFVSLREKFDFALVSKDGDIPISIRYAETLAHKLLETNLSAIIDLYELKHHDRILFVKRFLDAMINAPKELWHPCLVVVDEAHTFCPESSKAESMGAVIDLCTRGRKRGFAAVLATQRLSKLHKDAAAECMNKLIGRTGLDIDRKRAAEELGMTNKSDMLRLRELIPGEFYGFGAAISNEVRKIKIGKVITSHPQSGNRQLSLPPTPNAVKKIVSKLSNIPEEAEKELNTKKELEAEVIRLKREIRQYKSKEGSTTIVVEPVEMNKWRKKLNDAEEKNVKVEKENYSIKDQYNNLLKELKSVYSKYKEARPLSNKLVVVAPSLSKNKGVPLPKDFVQPKRIAIATQPSNGTVSGGEKLILIACAQYPQGLRRDQLIVFTGYKKTSRDIFISRLKQNGYLAQEGERLVATDEGISVLGNEYERLPEGEELQRYWLNKLGGGEKEILNILIQHYPESITRDQLLEMTEYKKTSRDIFISRLSSRELVQVLGKGLIKASDNLFN